MTDTADTTPEEWWDRSLTSTGRREILQTAGLRLPSAVLWRHMSPEARAAVEMMRLKDQETPATLSSTEPPDPSVTITELRVNNALLRGSLFLTARRLKDYRDSRHVKTDEGFQLTVPESLPERADDALTRAHNLLKEPEPGRSV